MRELSQSECLAVKGAEDDTFDLNDVFAMIENGESKLLLLGTLVCFGTSYLGASITSRYGLGYGVLGGIGGILAGAYLLPATFIVTYMMVDQSYHFLGLVR